MIKVEKVKLIIIDDYTAEGSVFLDFDLIELLRSLDQFSHFEWNLYYYEYTELKKPVDSVINVLKGTRTESPLKVSWSTLNDIANVVSQTENALIEGKKADQFIKIEAIDSTLWEVTTNIEQAINNITRDFRKVVVEK